MYKKDVQDSTKSMTRVWKMWIWLYKNNNNLILNYSGQDIQTHASTFQFISDFLDLVFF